MLVDAKTCGSRAFNLIYSKKKRKRGDGKGMDETMNTWKEREKKPENIWSYAQKTFSLCCLVENCEKINKIIIYNHVL